MPCSKCGEKNTIRAHLIPQVFCKEVQTGKSHATAVKTDGSFHPTQSGTFDKNILCATCDGELGRLEEYAAIVFANIRKGSINRGFGIKECHGIDKDKILRFCAGILWKYSITSEEYGKIDLYSYQDEIKKIAFGEIEIPSWFDVALVRLLIHKQDDEVFAYRAPLNLKKQNVRLYNFMLGGMVCLVKANKKKMNFGDELSKILLNQEGELRYLLAPAEVSEEYRLSKQLANESSRLSAFLDKQDTTINR
ncbi:hypothetical protein [Thiohalophilus thiocyanatoxydans]|uniref:HNH endonuclease n=1 Tax=Thiohalophilus thiocyanatoxydans TaxID=381308 RepID=A0A4R8IPI1_9GAMM|nr:hypothetical protein [Thiohalophilus thiocyanatoxydans]TDY02418.1 hypothetical protein EDC23_0787 [Thiohalophilus thiocyanatoxydans]